MFGAFISLILDLIFSNKSSESNLRPVESLDIFIAPPEMSIEAFVGETSIVLDILDTNEVNFSSLKRTSKLYSLFFGFFNKLIFWKKPSFCRNLKFHFQGPHS